MALDEIGKDRRHLRERAVGTVGLQRRRRRGRDPAVDSGQSARPAACRRGTEQPLRLGRAHDLHVRARLLDRWHQPPHRLQHRRPRALPRSGRALWPAGRSRPANLLPARGPSPDPRARHEPRAMTDRPIPVTSCALSTKVVRPAIPALARSRRDSDDRGAPGPPPRVRPRHTACDRPWRQVTPDGIEQRDAERLDLGARLGAHVDPEIVGGHDRGLARVLLARSVRSTWQSTPATGPAVVSTRTCCASNCWSHNGCRDPLPIRWSRR